MAGCVGAAAAAPDQPALPLPEIATAMVHAGPGLAHRRKPRLTFGYAR